MVESAQVTGRPRIADHHLVGALAAVEQAGQQRLARPGDSPSLVALVLGVVVLEHLLDPLESLPVNVGRVLVLDEYSPLFHLQAFGSTYGALRAVRSRVAVLAVDEGSGVGGVFENGSEDRDCRLFPKDIS